MTDYDMCKYIYESRNDYNEKRVWINEMLIRNIMSSPFFQLSFVQYTAMCVSAYQFLFWWLWDYSYIILLSSNRKYESVAFVWD